MDSTIVERICNVPSACWFPRLVLTAFWGAFAGWSQLPAPSNVNDCQPCTLSPGADVPAYNFTFDIKPAGDRREITSIRVSSPSDPKLTQTLAVTGMEPLGKEEPFFFGGVDVNFDGLLDVMLITRRGVANAYAAYWLFNPKTKLFTPLGTYPVFRVDAEKRRLLTYERGGSGGMIHESKEYAFQNGKLLLMKDEKQEATQRPDVFRKVIRERVKGVMKVVKTETVRPPK